MFLKLGEAVAVSAAPLAATPVLLSQADEQITLYFQKFARDLKQIAPKAQDFLYFTAVMMHAAEACLLDEKGQLRKDAKGESLSGHWDTSRGWKWVCSDPNLQPYKNANNDIFPEQELLKAYKKWVGKPLCLDHQSQTVDMVRGIVVDTHYDPRGKRVIALCALDKKNYPDLARKVQTRYATSVSMGTGVGTAICTDCGRAATCESELCGHMKNKSCYGEINTDLSPIELSIVVNGADPNAHIKHVVAKDLSQSNSDSAWSEGIERYIADKMDSVGLHEGRATASTIGVSGRCQLVACGTFATGITEVRNTAKSKIHIRCRNANQVVGQNLILIEDLEVIAHLITHGLPELDFKVVGSCFLSVSQHFARSGSFNCLLCTLGYHRSGSGWWDAVCSLVTKCFLDDDGFGPWTDCSDLLRGNLIAADHTNRDTEFPRPDCKEIRFSNWCPCQAHQLKRAVRNRMCHNTWIRTSPAVMTNQQNHIHALVQSGHRCRARSTCASNHPAARVNLIH